MENSDGRNADRVPASNADLLRELQETDGMEVDAKEREHSSLREKLDKEPKEVDRKLEQKEVLQRKIEQAVLATKRIKELSKEATERVKEHFGSRRASSPETRGLGGRNGPGTQTIEHEHEVTVGVHEVRLAYWRQIEDDFPGSMSPGARNSRISALEHMLSTSFTTLLSMASQLSEAEEQEGAFSGKGRWNQIGSLAMAFIARQRSNLQREGDGSKRSKRKSSKAGNDES